jgi:hypothetical protein
MDGLDHAWNKTNRQGATEDSAYKTHFSNGIKQTGRGQQRTVLIKRISAGFRIRQVVGITL